MAVGDLPVLRDCLPDVFQDRPVPSSWEEDWIFVGVDLPESTVAASDPALVFNTERSDCAQTEAWTSPVFTPVAVPDFGAPAFPGAPESFDPSQSVPPPDALGFYLPFHYYYPDWWGVYLVLEGVQQLGQFVEHQAGGVLSLAESVTVARIFIYGHESFHHHVESFSTRLEVTHRTPIYKTGFDEYFRRTVGTGDCLEEALATAYGLGRVAEWGDKQKRVAAVGAVEAYILQLPEDYRAGLNYWPKQRFIRGRNEFAEVNHHVSLPGVPGNDPQLWTLSSYAFKGIGQVNSRVNYVVHRDSPIGARIQERGHYLRYREVAARLKALAGCVEVGRGKGSHMKWQAPSGATFPVSRHPGDFGQGVLLAIIRQAGLSMSVSEFAAARV
ncbi:MAG: hypothetical protein FD171_1071 [Actinobacteria bacterium]|nr:MAG: hypothetical protein FD171_1071 [Actinomycetota bacterium]